MYAMGTPVSLSHPASTRVQCRYCTMLVSVASHIKKESLRHTWH